MSYAVRNDGMGWRSVDSQDDVGADETYSETLPVLTPTPPQIIASVEQRIQDALDEGAQRWGYDSLVSAASYVSSTNKQFAAEAKSLVEWRDSVWEWALSCEAEIQSGAKPVPLPGDDFLEGMPSQPEKPTAS